jgi:hypothetical protein
MKKSFVSRVIQARWPMAITTAFLLAILLIAGWLLWPDPFFHAWWYGLMIWAQLSIGCLIVLLIQCLTGGEWGRTAAPVLRAGAAGYLVLAPLFIPPLLGLPHIFPWTDIQRGISDETLVNKEPWLNSPSFIIRTLFYLGLLGLLIAFWTRSASRSSEIGGPSLVLSILIISFCSCDWMMSLQPTFYSSLYPFLYFSGSMVSAFAFITGVLSWLQTRDILRADPDLFIDYGKLLFASVFFWGYIAFSQFIIVWSGNLPHEAEWYLVRSKGFWLIVTLLVIAGHFVIPFLTLLSHDLKRNTRKMVPICCGLFFMHTLEIFWLMRPTVGIPFHLSISPLDVILPLLIGALWIFSVLIFACRSNPRYVHV